MTISTGQSIDAIRKDGSQNRLLLADSLLILALTLAALAALLSFRQDLEDIAHTHTRHIELVTRMHDTALLRTTLLSELVELDDPFAADERMLAHNQAATDFYTARQELSAENLAPTERALLDEATELTMQLYPFQEAIKELALRGDKGRAARLLAVQAVPRQRVLLDRLERIADYNRVEIDHAAEKMRNRLAYYVLFICLAGVLAWAVLFAAKYRVQRTQARLLDDLSRSADERETLLHSLEYQKFALDEHAIVSIADPGGMITYANKKFCEISGYSEEELLGRSHNILNSGYHGTEFFRELWRTISSGRVWHGVIRNRRKDGSFYWVTTSIVPFLDKTGRPYQYVGVRTDITRLKETESDLARANTELMLTTRDAIQAREAAQHANAAKSEFLSVMSHEFRTPINAVMGFSEIMLAEHPEPDWEYAQEAQLIHNAGQSLLAMVSSIFEYIELEDADWSTNDESCDLAALMNEVHDAYEAKARHKGLQLKIEPVIHCGGVAANPSRLFEVIKVLVCNAIEITESGEVSLSCQPLTRDEGDESKAYWQVSVRDTGPGVPAGCEESVFEAFRQGADSLTRIHQGIGLGLAIAKRIVEAYGGRIWYEPAPGGGALFQFTLPARGDATP